MFNKIVFVILLTLINLSGYNNVAASINHLKPISWSVELQPSTEVNGLGLDVSTEKPQSNEHQFIDIDKQTPGKSSTIQGLNTDNNSKVNFDNDSNLKSYLDQAAATMKSQTSEHLLPVGWSIEQPAVRTLPVNNNELDIVKQNFVTNNGNFSAPTSLAYNNFKNLISDMNIQSPVIQKHLFDEYLMSMPVQNNYISSNLMNEAKYQILPNQLDQKILNSLIQISPAINQLQQQQPSVLAQTRQKTTGTNNKKSNAGTISNGKSSNTNGWLKPFSTKRRSYDPLLLNDGIRVAKVRFDDGNDFESLASKNQKDYYSSLPSNIYDSSPSHSSQLNDNINSIVDNLIASSKYSGVTHHQAMPIYYAAGIHPTSHKYSFSSRKGLEKSIGFPILIGIGAALISFLVLSNLFLTIPLLAMTLMQFLNGNNMFMPNNNSNNNPMPNNNNGNGYNGNNGNNGQTTVMGRKKRDLANIELEQRIQSAIEKMYNNY